MADSILSGDITVYYSADNSRKQIKWTGSATGTRTVNELYSALQDLFDELAQLDDGTPMSAQTPTEYTIGAIDASDKVPWFIDDETIQHLKTGAIKTNLWTRITGTQAGIVKVSYPIGSNAIVYGDIGYTVQASAGSTSSGTLLDFQNDGTNINLFIRPTDATATHDFTSGSMTLTCNSHSSGATTVVTTTGEALWANIYSLGSLPTDVGKNAMSDLYVYRNGVKVRRYNSGALAYQWWPTGHIDILIKVKEPGATPFTGTTSNGVNTITSMSINAGLLRVGQPIFGSGIPAGTTISAITSNNSITLSANATGASTNIYANTIDGGYVTVFAREFDTTYDYFTVDLNSGGRNPIPLATGSDLNNTVGIRQLTSTAGSGTFVAGEIIYTGASLAAATAKGVITKVTGTSPNQVIRYYLIGDLTDLSVTVTGAYSTATCTSGSFADNADVDSGSVTVNPKSFSGSGLGITFGAFSDDINNGNGTKLYSIKIDPGANKYSLAKMYEWTKYVARRGSVDTTNNSGINGERYIGAETILTYTSATGFTYSVGTVIFQASTGAFGTVVAHENSNTVSQTGSWTKYVLLRNVRGTFTAASVTDGTNSFTPTGVNTFTPIKADPYGTFAGGKFFAATGVMFNRTNLAATDIQAYQLTALDGTTQIPPNIVSVAITGLVTGDSAGVFRATNGVVNKTQYTSSTGNTVGASTLTMNSSIGTDEPQAGYIRMVVVGAGGLNEEHRYRYSSWTGAAFTLVSLSNFTLNASGTVVSGNLFSLTSASALDASAQVGDMVYNSTAGSHRYGPITYISGDRKTIYVRVIGPDPVVGDWNSTDALTINKLVKAYTSGTDKAYVPIIDYYVSSGTSISNSLIYSTDISVIARVRQYKSIVPFEQATTVGSTGLTVSSIRSSDLIAT